MSEVPPALDKKEKNWITRILKLIFILSAFLLVGITVLANMGGSNNGLKDSVEQFVSGLVQGRPARVEKLVHMSFFPRLGFDAEGINVLSSLEDGYNIVEVGKVQVFMKFWDVALRRPRVKQFYIEDFKAIKGAIGPREFYIEKIFIDHDIESGKAELKGNGKIGDDPWNFELSIDILGSKGNYRYIFKRAAPFIFNVAEINAKAVFIGHEDGYFKFEDFNIISGDIELNGNLVLSALGKKMLKLKGEVFSRGSEKPLSPDLIFDYSRSPVKIDGSISAKDFTNQIKDIDILLQRFREIAGFKFVATDDENSNWNNLFDFSNVKILNPQAQE